MLAMDYNMYGGGGQGTRMLRNGQRSFNGMNEYYMEPSTPPGNHRASSQKRTRKIHPMPVSNVYDGASMYQPVQGNSFDDSEPYISGKQTSRARVPENNLLKIFIELIDNGMVLVDLTQYVEKHEFVFDAVLNEEVTNDEVYHETVEPIVPIIFQRTKATCFAYGQTGSGKTYTMKPLPLKASRDILRLMYHTYRNQGFQLFVSFFEIYGGKLFDLLNDRKKLCMREDGKQQVCIVGLQEYRVADVETIKELIEKGSSTRSTGTTGANEESSRSHAILQLAIKRSADGNESKPPRLVGKLSFIDLAGSERGADTTDNDKQTRVKSLSKGNNPKKDVLSSNFNLKESTTIPLSSVTTSTFEDRTADAWPEEDDGDEFSPSEEYCEQVKPSWKKNGKMEPFGTTDNKFKKPNSQIKWKDIPKVEPKVANSDDDDLNALLQEEEELVNAHRKQVEETMNIVKEEMNLLVEADQPGNQLDDYITRLNAILSQKASAILQLQTRLAHFQKTFKGS
ncbi:kinesin-like protein KIN-13B [Senna tora]|uniref:Kinesin-like protein n=1 Tax=Senna tora TaxID=362788 RepID=A0A835CKE9_9FABA|nr:kinesin-like protein KIN-13B [Senna tora]